MNNNSESYVQLSYLDPVICFCARNLVLQQLGCKFHSTCPPIRIIIKNLNSIRC